jgi:hypothetical protein
MLARSLRMVPEKTGRVQRHRQHECRGDATLHFPRGTSPKRDGSNHQQKDLSPTETFIS